MDTAADDDDSTAGVCRSTLLGLVVIVSTIDRIVGITGNDRIFSTDLDMRRFPPELWTHFDNNGPRTTNVAEG